MSLISETSIKKKQSAKKNAKIQVSFFLSVHRRCVSKGGAKKTMVVTEVEKKMAASLPVVPNTVKLSDVLQFW